MKNKKLQSWWFRATVAYGICIYVRHQKLVANVSKEKAHYVKRTKLTTSRLDLTIGNYRCSSSVGLRRSKFLSNYFLPSYCLNPHIRLYVVGQSTVSQAIGLPNSNKFLGPDNDGPLQFHKRPKYELIFVNRNILTAFFSFLFFSVIVISFHECIVIMQMIISRIVFFLM